MGVEAQGQDTGGGGEQTPETVQGGQELQTQVRGLEQVLRETQGQLGESQSQVQNLRQAHETQKQYLDRVRKAFTGEEDKPLTESQKRIARVNQLSQYLSHEVEENRKSGGQGLPITSKIGQELVTFAQETQAENETLKRRLDEIEARQKRQDNPAWQQVERGAQIMEGMLQDSLEQLYPGGQEMNAVRGAQFNAITALVHAEIKDLMANDTESLQKVMRSPQNMRKMVNYFASQILPPKVRALLDEQAEMSAPVSQQDIAQAFAEARENWIKAQEAGDVRATAHWSEIMTRARQDIFAGQIMGKRGGEPDKPTMQRLMSTMVGGRG